MSGTWRDAAIRRIQAVTGTREYQVATVAQRCRMLRDAYPFGPREHFPYKVWCEEVRKALTGETKKAAKMKREQDAGAGLFKGGERGEG